MHSSFCRMWNAVGTDSRTWTSIGTFTLLKSFTVHSNSALMHSMRTNNNYFRCWIILHVLNTAHRLLRYDWPAPKPSRSENKIIGLRQINRPTNENSSSSQSTSFVGSSSKRNIQMSCFYWRMISVLVAWLLIEGVFELISTETYAVNYYHWVKKK